MFRIYTNATFFSCPLTFYIVSFACMLRTLTHNCQLKRISRACQKTDRQLSSAGIWKSILFVLHKPDSRFVSVSVSESESVSASWQRRNFEYRTWLDGLWLEVDSGRCAAGWIYVWLMHSIITVFSCYTRQTHSWMHPSTGNRSKKKRKTCNEGKSSKGNAEWDREPGAWDGPTLDGSSVTDADNSGPRESEQVRDDDNHYHSATKVSTKQGR